MDEYMGIIKLFAGNFAPQGWLYCSGQILPISQYTALFSLLGTTYGGNGQTTFALPDLRSRVPVGGGMGAAPDGSNIQLGQVGGTSTVTLNGTQLPPHSHTLSVSSENAAQSAATAGTAIATPGALNGRTFAGTLGFNTSTPNTVLSPASIAGGGQGLPHDNMQPYLGLSYIICVNGLYPSRP